ncbi:unnamed protein product [Lasius platythorax]|uniref:Uncharacterized protein n=1 Tax=Lasius platythorax TaxID=488582 RepID=A0AAV2N8P4_9HYME
MPWRFLSEALQSMAARWETRKGGKGGGARGKGGWPFANEKSFLVTRAGERGVRSSVRTDAILKTRQIKVIPEQVPEIILT